MGGVGKDRSACVNDTNRHQLVGCEGTGLVEQTMRHCAGEEVWCCLQYV